MHIDVQLLQSIFEKENTFSTEMLMHLCQRSIGRICVGLFMGFLFCSIDLCLPVLYQYHTSISLRVMYVLLFLYNKSLSQAV